MIILASFFCKLLRKKTF